MLRRLLLPLVAVVLFAGGCAALAQQPTTKTPKRTADYVVIAGAPGLRWDDVDPETTPTLWRMAERGSIGSLSVRSARRPTCPVDGWLTLGAGNYAAWDGQPVTEECRPPRVTIERPDGIGAFLPDQRAVVRHNQEKLRWGAVPGALAESVRCSVAIGPGAAIAAARPFGRVDRYRPSLPDDLADLLASCVLSIVDLGTVAGEEPEERAAAAARADAALARVLDARPERSLVIVAGIADTDHTSRLHVAIADGPGWDQSWLTSASTGRVGYLQLVDLAPTALAALGRPAPERLFAGKPATTAEGRPHDLPAAIARPADADREARAQRHVATWFFAVLTGAQLVLAVVSVPLLRRARRHGGPIEDRPAPRWLVATVQLLLVGAALAIPAALIADLVPWWRSGEAGWVFAGVLLLALALTTAVVRGAPWYASTLGPMGMVAGVGAVVVGADVLTGARLQLNGVAGYSALEGMRYAGIGTVGLGVIIAGVLLAAGCLAQRVRRSWRPAVIVVVGGAAVIVVGSPYLGADPVGAIALTAGVSIAAAISTGGWVTFPRFAWATIAGLAVTAGFAFLDLQRPAAERGSLGRFLTELSEGTGGLTVQRVGTANVAALVSSPLSLLAIVAAILVWFALLQPWGGLKRLFGLYPAVRAGMAGIAVASLLGGVLSGSALNVAGAAAALTVPMATMAALRVLDHAGVRTHLPSPTSESPPAAAAGSTAGSADAATVQATAEESTAAERTAETPAPAKTAPAPPPAKTTAAEVTRAATTMDPDTPGDEDTTPRREEPVGG